MGPIVAALLLACASAAAPLSDDGSSAAAALSDGNRRLAHDNTLEGRSHHCCGDPHGGQVGGTGGGCGPSSYQGHDNYFYGVFGCGFGQFQTSRGKCGLTIGNQCSWCEDCVAGMYKPPSSERPPCDEATECLGEICAVGEYGPMRAASAEEATCDPITFLCPPGMMYKPQGYATSNDVAGACASCPAGYQTDTLGEAGATTCELCPNDTYDHDGNSSTPCEATLTRTPTNSPTPFGHIVCEGTNACSSCSGHSCSYSGPKRYCEPGVDCTLICSGENACSHLRIYAPTNHTLAVRCLGGSGFTCSGLPVTPLAPFRRSSTSALEVPNAVLILLQLRSQEDLCRKSRRCTLRMRNHIICLREQGTYVLSRL